jgi:hypothetical protein
MQYQCVVLHLFEHFPTSGTPDYVSTISTVKPPYPYIAPEKASQISEIRSLATKRLRSVLNMYQQNYQWQIPMPLLTHALAMGVRTTFPDATRTPDDVSTIVQSLEGLLGLSASTMLSKTVLRTLQLNIDKLGIVVPPEAKALLANFEAHHWSRRDFEAVKSEWPIDLDPTSATATSVCDRASSVMGGSSPSRAAGSPMTSLGHAGSRPISRDEHEHQDADEDEDEEMAD